MDDDFPLRWETFHLDDSPVGALVRRLHPAGLDTLTCFREPGGTLVHLEHTLAFIDDPRDWTRFRYRGVHAGSLVERTAAETTGALPSYGEFVMVDRIGSGSSEVAYQALREDAPGDPPIDVLLRSVGSELITTPGGAVIDCTRVEVTENGSRTNTHWLDSSGLRASDWNGATSWRVAGRDELTRVPGLAAVIDAWLAGLTEANTVGEP